MFAALPMYDRPALRGAHDAFWALIRDRLRACGIGAPDALDRDTGHMAGWARQDLVLGQICNLPWRVRFAGRVTMIGAADYGLPETPAGYYHAVLIVRAGDRARGLADCAGYRFVLNEPLSNSGWGMAVQHAATIGLRLDPVLRSGAHAASAMAVARGQADLAAIDAVTWRYLAAEGATAGLRVIDRTPPQPGMTFITAAGADPAPFRDAIAAAIASLDPPAQMSLGLRGIVALPAAAYDIPLPPAPPEPVRDLHA